MRDKLSSLFGTLSEPVIAACGSEIIYRNTIAKHTDVFSKAPLEELVPELALAAEAKDFLTETMLGGEKYMISGTAFDDLRIYSFRRMSGSVGMQTTDVIASVSLSLREPLSVMNIAAGHLLPFVEKQGDERLSEYSSMMNQGLFSIVRALNRLDALVFLAGGTPAGSERTRLELVRLADELIDTVKAMLGIDERRLYLAAETETAYVMGDKRLIERMLLCLIGNALVFTEQDAGIRVGVKMLDDKAFVTVSDNGGGISEDARFDVWTRYGAWRDLDDTKRGAGFGLSVVQAIARAHGGGALMESRAGDGTTVLVSLDATPDDDILPVFETPEEFSTVNDMREIFAELVNIIPKDKFTRKYMD